MHKGEEIGLFKLGSTIVLVFEAPKGFVFTVNQGERLIMGQPLGTTKSIEARIFTHTHTHAYTHTHAHTQTH